MSEKKFKAALSDYAGAVTVMSFSAGQAEGFSILSPEQQRARCLSKFAALKSCWSRDAETIAKLEALTNAAIAAFADGDTDKGHLTVKEIDAILWNIN